MTRSVAVFVPTALLLHCVFPLHPLAALSAAAADPAQKPSPPLLQETFDDPRLLSREWYDGDRFDINTTEKFLGTGCLEYRWKAGSTNPFNSSGIRRRFEPGESVSLRCHLRLSKDWGWSGRDYHPHLMLFMTTENEAYAGPAASRLTVYIEPCNGKLRLAAQDIQNKDAPHGLTQGPLKGGYNGRPFDSEEVLFNDNEWHCIEAYYQLNSIDFASDRANADGIVRGWFDGRLVIDRTDVILRSPDYPDMKFNQFLLLPYFGPDLLPHAQTLWIDELAVGRERIGPIPLNAKSSGGD